MKKPKPTPADYKKREELERKDFAGVEHNEFMAAFDWETELFEKDGKYGLRTALGEEIVPPAFEDFRLLRPAELEHGDRVVAQHNGKWGVLIADGRGAWLVEPEYDYIGYPNNLAPACIGEKWGVINIPANKSLIPIECDMVHVDHGFLFINGIGSYEKDGKTGIIREDGAFTEAIFEDTDLDFEGALKVKLNGEWGFINEHGTFTTDEEDDRWCFYLD